MSEEAEHHVIGCPLWNERFKDGPYRAEKAE